MYIKHPYNLGFLRTHERHKDSIENMYNYIKSTFLQSPEYVCTSTTVSASSKDLYIYGSSFFSSQLRLWGFT